MPMKLYMAPGSCTTGIHILMEELELPFEAWIVNIPKGDHLKADYVAINPKSTIPTLVRDNGAPLTEWGAIAWWLARKYPRAGLLPDDLDGEVRVLEIMNYCVGVLHMQGFARLFNTAAFAGGEGGHRAAELRGRDIVAQGFDLMNDELAGRDYLAGRFSIADAALFYNEFWAGKLQIALPDNCAAHYRRMIARPAVQRVLREEGYAIG